MPVPPVGPDDPTWRRALYWWWGLAVVVLIGAMFVFTVVAFEVMESLPVVATGGGAH